jgi:hypothetical protein
MQMEWTNGVPRTRVCEVRPVAQALKLRNKPLCNVEKLHCHCNIMELRPTFRRHRSFSSSTLAPIATMSFTVLCRHQNLSKRSETCRVGSTMSPSRGREGKTSDRNVLTRLPASKAWMWRPSICKSKKEPAAT